MENTQVIDWDAEEEETEISNGSLGYSLEPIGRLRLFSSAHGPERDFPLYLGKNVVGRSPDCSVTLPFPSISKQHAVIEISAYNKAPILQDCGSLNGTQLVMPPKVLTPGVSHRLKDQELILFADFPCQYRRLDVPPPLVSRGFLTIEGTPRTQGESQTSRVLLAEDSEEEVDFPSGRCVANGSRNPTSPSATVVPESDEEASSPAPRVPGLSLPFDVGSDTDEEQGQQPAVGGSSSARAGAAAAEAEQPGVKGMTAGIQLGQAQPTEPKFKDTKVKSEAGNGAAQVGSVLERSLTLGEDSDTDVEGEGVPMTPCVGPGKKKQALLGVGTGDPGAPGVGHVQGSPASAVEEGRAPVAVPSETNHTPMVIDSDTDEDGEVSAALTLAHLKERGITLWSRDSGMEDVKSQPQVLVERSQSASGRDSDTDVEEGKREMVPDSPMDTESQPPHRARDGGEDVDMNSPGGHLEGNQASSATVDNNATQVEEEVPPEPAVTLGEKHQLPLEEAQPSEEAWEAAVGEGSSSAVADVRKSQQLVAEYAGRECATAVSEAESTLEVGAQSRSPTAPVEQVVVYTGTRGDPTQPQREGAQMGRTKTAKDCSDESDDLCLPATQCFVERESQSSAAQSLEDEPTQGFLCTLPQEPGPSHLSLQTPGAGALDVPWEVLATQPFCLREPEASEPQLIATHLEAHGSPPSLPSAPPGHQHLVHTELSGVQGREIQTMEKAMGIPKETADRVTPEREPLERKVRERASDSEREDVMGEELPQVTEDREPKTVLVRDGQGQESNKAKGGDPEGNRESLKVEMEMSKDTQKREREMGKPEPEREWEPAGLEVNLDRGVAEGGSHDQKEQIASPTLKPGLGMGDLEGLTSAPPVCGTQGDGGKGDPVSPGRQQRGRLSCEMMSAGKASGGDPEPPAHCLLSPVPEASAPPQSLLTSQSPKQSPPPPLTSSPSEPHLPESLHTEPHVRPRRSSRMTPSSSAALKPYTACSTDLPAAPRPTSQVIRNRANKSSARTPEVIVPIDSELQPPASTEQPAIPRPTSQVIQGSTDSSFDKTPESVLTGPEIQPPTTEQPVTPNPTPRATRGRSSRSSVKTPELNVPTSSELQPPTSTEQAVIPKPISRATRGRARKSPIRTPEPVVPTVSEIQPPTSTEQAVIPKPTSRASRGRPRKSIRTPEPVVPTGPELQPVISTEEPVTPNLTSQSSQGRSRKSVRTPIVPTGPEFQPAISTEQPVTPELSSQGRARRSSVRTEASISTAPELKPFTSRKPPAPKPTALGTRGRTCKPSIEECKSVEPVAPNFDPPISTDHLVTPEVTDQSITLKSSPLSASTVSTTPELEPGPPEPVPQGSRRRRRKAVGKQGSQIVPIDHEPYSAPSKPESQPSTNQSSGTLEEAELITVAPEAAIAQVPETPPHIPLMQKEAAGRSGLTPKPQPEASRVHKEPSTTTDSPLQKRPRRQVPQMTIVPKEEDPPEMPVKEEPQERAIPVPGKRKRGRAEDETQGNPSRSRRAKPNQEAVAPKVLFTGVVDSRGERAVLALGGSLASSVNEASHLVTDRIRRTVKFLCALGKGIPILSLNWLYQSRKAGHFLPPDDYLVTDPEQEKNFSFSLRDALSRARERKLLEGYEIHVTPRVQPPPAQMAEIIGCCGGTVLPSMPHSYKPQRVVVTCTEDLPRCAVPSRLGLPLLSSEFLLTGVLKQEATPEAFVLSNLEMLSS
ncbi:mediator of DNA damage checkpoint protein 1 isoform X1 [Alexandromys fortis]|uniref:mediator of DNA damage checkpoint protein 1 isoform X1 n=1 Tax=Alexandromys fortis TaxID=100897 RepID=UPI002152FF23|nr:mediator of DNA damage checkpoint protein 1 isoform X1 [Microtus fortis]XP_049987678.1 mediator of DNA damage checkpoint protein 1 isoform X1 [Microtus fortis]XP_049987679.1 mediator of DNA damage checkpoint protein 1 isoform X1 [Microtus fortis]